jgi:hypothetical protein
VVDGQPSKHCLPLEVTEFGKKMYDNEEHPFKQDTPIEITEFGMEMDDNEKTFFKTRFAN